MENEMVAIPLNGDGTPALVDGAYMVADATSDPIARWARLTDGVWYGDDDRVLPYLPTMYGSVIE